MDDSRQRTLAIIAVVLIVVALLIFFWQYRRSQPEMVQITPQDIQKEIERIQNDPQMPPQAKQAAIEQLRARTGIPQQGPPSTGQ